MYLAAAGIGRIGLVDFDVVDFTNLQRQVIHGTKDVGPQEAGLGGGDHARHQSVTSRSIGTRSRSPARTRSKILKDYDIVVDGTDNFPTRYLVNDACVLLGKPNVYGSIFRFEGQATVFAYQGGPCYRCLYPEPPPPGLVPSCAEGGVLGILPGTIGLIQATETVKLILGIGEPLVGRLLLYDALAMRFRELKLRRNPECPVCGDHPTIHELIDYQQFCGIPNQPHEPVADGRRYRSGGSESQDRSRRSVRSDRRARAARISDLPDSERDQKDAPIEGPGGPGERSAHRRGHHERHARIFVSPTGPAGGENLGGSGDLP